MRFLFVCLLVCLFCFPVVAQPNYLSYQYIRPNSTLEFKYPDYYKVKEADGGINVIDTFAKGKRAPKWTIWPMDVQNGVGIDETIENTKAEIGAGCTEKRDTIRIGGLPTVRVVLTNIKTQATTALLLFLEKNQDVYEIEALKPNMVELEDFIQSISFQ
jgi:hypothetical protein